MLQFFSFLTLLSETASRVALVSTVDISFVARLKHGMSSLDENLKEAHPQGPSSRLRTLDNRKHIEPNIWKKIDFRDFQVLTFLGRRPQRNVQRTFLGKKSIFESSLGILKHCKDI